MGVKINFLSERLNDGHHAGAKLCAGCGQEVFDEGLSSRLTKIPEELALILKEYPQHLGDGEDNLSVGNIQEKFLPHPLTPFLPPLRMAGGAKSALALS